MAFLRLLIVGFIAGFLAVLIFHQSLWYMLNVVGLIPLERPAWPLEPVPPLGVPSILSKAFWGGIWGALLAPILNLRGAAYWIGWIVVGALATTFVAMFVLPPMKGEPIPQLWPRLVAALMVNAGWGFGTALFLKLFRGFRGRELGQLQRD